MISKSLITYVFKESQTEHSLLTYSKSSIFLAVLVYVDDLVFVQNNEEACDKFKQYHRKCFHMKDIEKLNFFFGIELAQGQKGLFICQRKYTLYILNECDMLVFKPSSFPMEQNCKLALVNGASYFDPLKYITLVSRLIYLTIIRPNLTYYVHVLSQFMQNLFKTIWMQQ